MTSIETFGHSLLPLTMNKGHINAKLAERVFAVRTRYLELKKDRPERHAIRNLLGMLAFRMDRFEEALEYIDKVLCAGEDPDNLNALANRKYMCEKLLMFPEARQCEQRITKLLVPDGTNDCEKKGQRLRARSLAEQAFAHSFEPFGESVTFERYRNSVELYQQAIDLAGDTIDQEELEDWLFSSGMASYTIYMRIRWNKSQRVDPKARFQKAVDNFINIVRISKDNSLVSDSWRYLGELFEKTNELLPSVPNNFQIYVRHPEKCFQKALSSSPDNPRIIARYADYCKRASPSHALSLLNRSIEQDPTVFNIRAYYIRANIYLEQYKQCPKLSFLEKAEKDLEVTLEYSFTPWHLESMAEVFYLKARDPTHQKEGRETRKNLQKALIFCAKAVACQDGQKRPEVYKLRGECLCALGEHQRALGCYKRAVECETAAHLFRGSDKLLVLEYGHILKATPAPLLSDSPLLADMVYWLHQVAESCHAANTTLQSLSKLKELPQHWFSFVMYCHDNKHNKKYQSINWAGTDRRNRRDYDSNRRRSLCVSGERLQHPMPLKRRHNSFPGTVNSATHFYPASISDDIPKKMDKDKNDLESVTTSLATVELDETVTVTDHKQAESPSIPTEMDKDRRNVDSAKCLDTVGFTDTITITYSMDLETGKTKHITTVPSSQDCPADGFSSRHVTSAPERPLNHKLPYDFFVIYSDSESEWVEHCLWKELVGNGLRGCYKDRNFCLGKPKLSDYSHYIESSACIILVITKDFEMDNYAFKGMLMAMDANKLVIPVLREVRDIPVPLRPYSGLDATGAVDWARLQRCIEQHVKLDVSYEG